MGEPITVPLWLFVAIAVFALWSLLDRLLIPSGRWFVRRRLNRLIDRVNQKLAVEIKPFQLTKRQVLIDRLVYDPQVVAAANEHARANNLPREVAMVEVRRYAREIVPTFNAYIYFRVGYSIARAVARFLYRVRLGFADERTLGRRAAEHRRGVRHEPPQQHGLRAGRLPGRRAHGAQLRRRRMGAHLAIAAAHPLDGRLLRAPQLQQPDLPPGAGALRPHGDRGRRRPGDVSRRRPVARRPAARTQARPVRLHAEIVRSQGNERHRLRAGGAQLRPRARGSHAAPLARPRDAPAQRLVRRPHDARLLARASSA